MDRRALLAVCGALAAMLALPAVASAADGPSLSDTASAVDTTWVIVAGVLGMFMQAGFAFLEIGFSRMKNAGAGVAKILMNFSSASLAYWAGGFALAFGGGWLAKNIGMQDFAGSTVVHLIGATGALAALLLLGPRRGKYGPDGKPRAIPGHSMPLVGLGILILWLGWFGFNPGSTLGAIGNRFAEVVLVTNLAAAAGVITAAITSRLLQKTIDIGMVGNGAIAALVAITAPAGYVEYWAAPIIGGVAGVIVVVCVLAIDKVLDHPVGALSAPGVAGLWGTLSCGIFTSPRPAG